MGADTDNESAPIFAPGKYHTAQPHRPIRHGIKFSLARDRFGPGGA